MGGGVRMHPLAGQIISKSCSFSSETEFTPLILAPTSGFSYDSHTLCKIPEIRTPLFQKSAYGPEECPYFDLKIITSVSWTFRFISFTNMYPKVTMTIANVKYSEIF